MKKHSLIFVLACMALCLAPLLGMLFRPTTQSTENRAMAEFPALTARDGGVNLDFFPGLEAWFNDHFAFRNELVYADALVQGELFHVSSVESVVYGKDGWLFYASTLNDYLGREPLSERELHNLAHNLALVSDYVQQRGARFLFCVPPNKNTLYGQFMPDWADGAAGGEHNMEKLEPLLREYGVPYADLLALFRAEDEILYLKRDSHWNNKGAVLAADCLLDALGCPHEDYSAAEVMRARDADGDLNRMLYTLYGEKSVDYHYAIPQRFRYAAPDADVEDGWLETAGGSGNPSLLMFRDSFGNTLIPLLANDFEQAWFSKEMPCGLEPRMDRLQPQVVVMEKVERNIAEYLTMPPILSAPQAELPPAEAQIEAEAALRLAPLDYDRDYWQLSGELDPALLEARTQIFVRVNGLAYAAYHTGENGFVLYLRREALRLPAEVEVLLQNGEHWSALPAREVEESP